MKKINKILALLLALIMVLAMGAVAFAENEGGEGTETGEQGGGTTAATKGSITITLPTDNAGTDEEITYTLYKVFDATNNGTTAAISYKIDATNGALSEAMTAAGFSVDSAGNVSGPSSLNADAMAAIAAYAQDEIGTYTAKPSDGTLTISDLDFGYYYITTTTGTLVTIDSTNPNAEVQDKNTIPDIPEKKIVEGEDFVGSLDEDGKKALAQVGTTVHFEVVVKKTAGATNYVFHDVMDDGLSYNNDVAVNPDVVANTTTADGDTITVTFDNDKLAALENGTEIKITYSAVVTSDALTTDPANNTASLDYGDGHTTESDTVEVYNAKFTVTKKDGDGQPLAGAGFVIKNAESKYYKLENNVVSWVDTEEEATEYTSDDAGAVTAFTGLANGTYTLVEKTVPAGYNKAADLEFTIAEHDYDTTNLEQTADVTNNSGAELPSTGGIGTTIFYVAGSILALAAAILLVTRRRMNSEN
jgi:fimbrial isopeptide formation D2 family protein/LPXTG-motif cell wall-anchored protein